MCNQTNVPSVSLQTAVLMQVKEFATNSQMFSVHDITVAIRNKCASGDLEVPEVEVTGASFRFDIPHAKVKGIFDELWRTGVFDPMLTLSRQFNGKYFEYSPTLTQPAVSAPSQTFTTPVAIIPLSTPPSMNMSPNNELRVKTYLDNCKAKNFRPTLKQIQSAIKRNDVPCQTCNELKDYITSLGYIIVPDPEAISRSQVVTV